MIRKPKSVVVVGGGIAGLYASHLLLKSGLHVTLVEKNKEFGGRIRTVIYDGELMNTGASRFMNYHKLSFHLLKEFDLHGNLIPIEPRVTYIKDTYKKTIPFNTILNDIINKALKDNQDRLKKITFKMFIQEHYNASLVDDIMYSFGYNTEFDLMNAYDAVKIFQRDFRDGGDGKYYVVAGGLGELVDRLVASLKKRGCKMITGSEVISLKKGSLIMHDKTIIKCDGIILAMEKAGFNNMSGLLENHLLQRALHGIGESPLHRIFAKFPVDKNTGCWFQDFGRITTNNVLRHIIPINSKTGFIMISYTDAENARMWNNVKPALKENIMYHIRRMFPDRQIPDPLWIKSYYWDTGLHYAKQNAVTYKNTLKLFHNFGYVVCGELFSPINHGWVEGSLVSAAQAVNILVKAI